MTDLSAHKAHRDYVSGVLFYYHENDIIAGDPNEGNWHECHYPVPRRLGGEQTVPMLAEHHAIQGVLQSEEFGVSCVFGWEKHYVPSKLFYLFKKWMSLQRSETQLNAWANYSEKEKEKRCQSISTGTALYFSKENETERNERIERQILHSTKKKAIIVTAPDGREFEFDSIRGAARELELDSSRLTGVLKGRYSSTMGFTARYD